MRINYDIPTCLTVHRKRSWAVGGGCCWTIWLQCSYMLWISTTGKKNISNTRQNRTVFFKMLYISYTYIHLSCYGHPYGPTLIFLPSLPRKMSGRMTGCHFTPSRGCSTSLTWWRTLTETGRPESYGPSYRCTIRNKTRRTSVWLYQKSDSESLHIVSVIYSWRSPSFSEMWRLSLLSSTETYGEAMWQRVQKAQSSLIQPPSMAIQNSSWVLQGCSVASTALFTPPTMKRFLKHQALQRETSFTNSSIIWITGTTLVVATGALQ